LSSTPQQPLQPFWATPISARKLRILTLTSVLIIPTETESVFVINIVVGQRGTDGDVHLGLLTMADNVNQCAHVNLLKANDTLGIHEFEYWTLFDFENGSEEADK
jgi:hypothetical protein